MKTCSTCKIEKEISFFYKKIKMKDGLRKSCKDCYNESRRIYIIKNPRKSRKEYFRNRRENDLLFKLQCNISASLRNCLNEKFYSKKSRTYEILGCSYSDFKIYIEEQFEDWMNWSNHGSYTGNYNETWQFDHKIPLSSANNEEELIKLHHYTNYQPLCSKVNQYDKKDRLDFYI